MSTLQIYCLLFLTTALFAVLLDKIPQLDPDFTFIAVIIGVSICLYAVYFDRVFNGPMTAELYEERVWLAFQVGGTPIVVWQVYKLVRAWRIIFSRIWARITYGDTTKGADALAADAEPAQEEGD